MLVSLATYNERDNLEPLIAEIQKFLPNADLLVIDDNSPDGTGQLADELAAHVDVGVLGPEGEAADEAALDHHVRIALEDVAILDVKRGDEEGVLRADDLVAQVARLFA
ncbi:MAG: glycosyltransferase [Pleurocapsa sp. SU_196_0]|nr:glycosyltransferase [Pleurocapsa sp. SU_196_0]